MNDFEQIKNDPKIIEIYNKIFKLEDINKFWAHHDIEHIENVTNMMEKILYKLGYNKDFIEEAKIAGFLHDTGCLEGKENHALRSYQFAKEYFKENSIELKNEDLVLEAIKIHSDGFDTNNAIALALIVSDKLDIKYTRVAKEGYNVVGMKELQYIRNIFMDICNNTFEINFICDSKINKIGLEEFYFTKKVFKAIKAFSNKFNLTPRVLFNNEEWIAFSKTIGDRF